LSRVHVTKLTPQLLQAATLLKPCKITILLEGFLDPDPSGKQITSVREVQVAERHEMTQDTGQVLVIDLTPIIEDKPGGPAKPIELKHHIQLELNPWRWGENKVIFRSIGAELGTFIFPLLK